MLLVVAMLIDTTPADFVGSRYVLEKLIESNPYFRQNWSAKVLDDTGTLALKEELKK